MDSVKVIQDIDAAIEVLHKAGQWLLDTGKNPSKWWHPQNMNKEFFLLHAEPEEFYVAIVDGKPAAAEIIQWDQRNQDWSSVDTETSPTALYIHWLCVDPKYSGIGLPKIMIEHAEKLAAEKQVQLIRVDTNAAEKKLREIYESLGFHLVGTHKENYRATAFYEKEHKY